MEPHLHDLGATQRFAIFSVPGIPLMADDESHLAADDLWSLRLRAGPGFSPKSKSGYCLPIV